MQALQKSKWWTITKIILQMFELLYVDLLYEIAMAMAVVKSEPEDVKIVEDAEFVVLQWPKSN